jgi:ABC-2 type transport system ATP-binding protein
MYALNITGLRKVYPNGNVALKDIDLSVEPGDFFGFLGENGAGKSTTIGIVTSLVMKTAGKVTIFGKDLDTDLQKVKRFIGLVPQEVNFNIFEKVMNVLIYQAGYYGVPRDIAQARAEYYLKKLGLWNQRDSICMHLSGGMKRRLMIARALVPLRASKEHPSLLILDEPTAGVDVELRRVIWDFLKELNQEGITIILTTHYLEEAENLCKTIAIIDKGKIIKQTKTHQLMAQLSKQTVICDLKSEVTTLSSGSAFTIRRLHKHQIEVDLAPNQTMNELFQYLQAANIEVVSLRNKSNRLETIFLDLIKANPTNLE